MGRYTIKALAPKVEKASMFDPHVPGETLEKALEGVPYRIAKSPQDAVKGADFVGFCVPTHLVYETMLQTLPYCKKGTVIFGQTSRKTPEAEAFDEYLKENPHSGLALATIHTMCDPSKSDPEKEILGIIRHNPQNNPDYEIVYHRARKFYSGMSEHIEEFGSVDEHDTRTANTQINTSRISLSIASAFAEAGCFPWLNERYGSGLDVMKFALAMRAASFPGHVYRGIQFGSRHGKRLVSQAISTESGLYRMVVGNQRKEYKERVLAAKKRLFGEGRLEPILSEEIMKTFARVFARGGIIKPNSNSSVIQLAVDFAENGRNPFADLKATTPMYTSLLCLMDYLFNSEGKLEAAIAAPFDFPEIRADDLIFHDQLQGWSDAMLFDNQAMYDSKHARMNARIGEKLDDKVLRVWVEASKVVVRVCRESMQKAIDSGRIEMINKQF